LVCTQCRQDSVTVGCPQQPGSGCGLAESRSRPRFGRVARDFRYRMPYLRVQKVQKSSRNNIKIRKFYSSFTLIYPIISKSEINTISDVQLYTFPTEGYILPEGSVTPGTKLCCDEVRSYPFVHVLLHVIHMFTCNLLCDSQR
jgi:hypothetical protein